LLGTFDRHNPSGGPSGVEGPNLSLDQYGPGEDFLTNDGVLDLPLQGLNREPSLSDSEIVGHAADLAVMALELEK